MSSRKKHIESLRKHNRNVREVNAGYFEIPFACEANHFSLHISLPQQFPKTQPVVRLFPPAQHPWVRADNQIVTGHAKLSSWTGHTSLGRILNEVIEHFMQFPPQIVPPSVNVMPPQQLQQGPYSQPTYGQGVYQSPSNYAGSGQYGPPPTYGGNYYAPGGTSPRLQPANPYAAAPNQMPGRSPPLRPISPQPSARGGNLTPQAPEPRRHSLPAPEQHQYRTGGPPPAGLGASQPNMAPPSANTTPPSQYISPQNPSQTSSQSASSSQSHTPQPLVPNAFAAIEKMTKEQLLAHLNDELVFADFFADLDEVKNTTNCQTSVADGNKQIAEETIALGEEAGAVLGEIEQLQTVLRALEEQVAEKRARRKTVLERYSSEAILSKLHAASNERDTSSEQIYDDFLNGKMELKLFLESYLTARQQYHSLAAGTERLAHSLAEDSQARANRTQPPAAAAAAPPPGHAQPQYPPSQYGAAGYSRYPPPNPPSLSQPANPYAMYPNPSQPIRY